MHRPQNRTAALLAAFWLCAGVPAGGTGAGGRLCRPAVERSRAELCAALRGGSAG